MKTGARHIDDRRRQGFSLIEATIAVLIVGVMLIAALMTLGASRTSQFVMESRSTGTHLAEDLMNEILAQAYEDPWVADGFGRESGETSSVRTGWDDVDDYDNWSASPPKAMDGSDLADLAGWTREVDVTYVDPDNLANATSSDTGVKRITVTVKHAGVEVASKTAIRTEAWPADAPAGLMDVLLVTKGTNPTSQEQKRIDLLESWQYTVTTITDSSSQGDYDAAVDGVDVVWISEEVNSSTPGSRLKNTTVGVVNGEGSLMNSLGICDKSQVVNTQSIWINNNSHYITEEFSTGWLAVFTSSQQALASKTAGKEAPGSTYLALLSPRHALLVIETGGGLYGGGSAAGRRVQLPWGGGGFDIDKLSDDGRTLLKRSLVWAGGKD